MVHAGEEAWQSDSSPTLHAVRAVSQAIERDEEQQHPLCLGEAGLLVQFRGGGAAAENEL